LIGSLEEMSVRNYTYAMTGRFRNLQRYEPPEIDNGEIEYDAAKADIYAVGIILFDMITLHLPTEEEEAKATFDTTGNMNMVPPEFRSVIKACWEPNPDKRPTALWMIRNIPNLKELVNRIITTATFEKEYLECIRYRIGCDYVASQ